MFSWRRNIFPAKLEHFKFKSHLDGRISFASHLNLGWNAHRLVSHQFRTKSCLPRPRSMLCHFLCHRRHGSPARSPVTHPDDGRLRRSATCAVGAGSSVSGMGRATWKMSGGDHWCPKRARTSGSVARRVERQRGGRQMGSARVIRRRQGRREQQIRGEEGTGDRGEWVLRALSSEAPFPRWCDPCPDPSLASASSFLLKWPSYLSMRRKKMKRMTNGPRVSFSNLEY